MPYFFRIQDPFLIAVLWILIGFNEDPDPSFYLTADPDPEPDPGSQTNADPDPGYTYKYQKAEFLHERYT